MVAKRHRAMERAGKYLQKGQNAKAIREFEKLLAQHPGDVRARHRLGDLCARDGQSERAVEVYLVVADAYAADGFHGRAAAVYKQALDIEPHQLEATLRMAEQYVKQGFDQDAVRHLNDAAAVFERAGQEQSQLQVLQWLVELAPANVDDRIYLAQLYARNDQHRRAWEEFSRAAMDLKAAERYDEFITIAERVSRYGEASVELLNGLASIYLDRDETERALQKLFVAVHAQPHNLDTLGLLARAFRRAGKPGKAILTCKEIARLLGENQDTERMCEAWRQVLEMDPTDAEARRMLAAQADHYPNAETDRQVIPERTTPLEDVVQTAAAAEAEVEMLTEEDFIEVLDAGFDEVPPTPSRDQMTLQVAVEDLVAAVEPARRARWSSEDNCDESLSPDLAEGLAEADFFIGQGLLDDAAEILDRLCARHHGHPEIEDRLDEILKLDGCSDEEATEITSRAFMNVRPDEVC